MTNNEPDTETCICGKEFVSAFNYEFCSGACDYNYHTKDEGQIE